MYNSRPKISGQNKLSIYKNSLEISEKLKQSAAKIIAFECYPGVDEQFLYGEIIAKIAGGGVVLRAEDYVLAQEKLQAKIGASLTDDALFGRFIYEPFASYIMAGAKDELAEQVAAAAASDQKLIIYGVGASQLVDADLVIYVNITRWQIQLNYKTGAPNWQMNNSAASWSEKIKRGYLFEWPLGDQIKENVLAISDFMLDLNQTEKIQMMATSDYMANLKRFTTQPFRLVPYFAPGVWGGHWMQKKFGIGQGEVNLAWAFDGVPEENSVLIETSGVEFEVPATDLVLSYPEQLMGEKVYGRYGKSFPIRFDYLDTMGGQNLSLQVHPTTDYAYKNFGALYTQDESYYMLACEKDAKAYLGVRSGISEKELIPAFKKAAVDKKFNAPHFVNEIPVKKHDHLLIPGGTIHCSGAGCVVLEISATPNRYTFKLWDWNRVDLDGKPRPINIGHGAKNINYEMDTAAVEKNLYNHFETLMDTIGHKKERTGLTRAEPFETERDTFNQKVHFTTDGNVQMLCLVEGDEIIIKNEDTESGIELTIHYGETFIIPASIATYSMRPGSAVSGNVITMKASVR